MKRIIFLSMIIGLTLIPYGCTDDLDQTPIDPDALTEVDVYSSPEQAKSALAKVYAALALTGQQGPAGQPDIADFDEGFSQFTRMLYNLQELTTDHAVVSWGDPGLPDLHNMSWGSGNDFITGMYFRLAQTVSFANSFIDRAQALAGDPEVQNYIAEARFVRAYTYSILMDLFGDAPIVTSVSTELPSRSPRSDVFDFVETELLDIQNLLPDSNEYGRVDKAAAWALLSRIYLNSEVYTGTAKWTECVTYSKKVIDEGGYSLHTTDANGNGTAYDDLFLADNNSNGAQNEFIFVVSFDGIQSQTYGGTTFIIHGATGGSMDPSSLGINGGWFGMRSTEALVEKFEANSFNGDNEPLAWDDKRAMFYTPGQNYKVNIIPNTFEDGYAVQKFSNIDSNGNPGSDSNGDFADTDLPIIRLAEVYLNYAEAVLRGGAGGDAAQALNYINELRERGYGNTSGNILSSDLDLQFILDERSRELYWEGLRRTDLIRYNYFTTSSYLWPYKAGVLAGTSAPSYRNIFPIPFDAIAANPNLSQNTGY